MEPDEFLSAVEEVLEGIRRVLDPARAPTVIGALPHTYEDKFTVLEWMGTLSLRALQQVLESMCLSFPFSTLIEWVSEGSSVSLAWHSERRCTFLNKDEIEEHSDSQQGAIASLVQWQKTTVRTRVEFTWEFSHLYEIYVYRGADKSNRISVAGGETRTTVRSESESSPEPQFTDVDSDVNITWLMQRACMRDGAVAWDFAINRTDKCCTPRRNATVESLFEFARELNEFTNRFVNLMEEVGRVNRVLDVSFACQRQIFVPVLPLMKPDDVPGCLSQEDMEALLSEHRRSLNEERDVVQRLMQSIQNTAALSFSEVFLVMLMKSMTVLLVVICESADHLEQLLKRDLQAVIGSTLDASLLDSYMEYHTRTYVRKDLKPLQCSFTIRADSSSSCAGTFGIEKPIAEGVFDPIYTFGHTAPPSSVMKLSLSAGTEMKFMPERTVHCLVRHSLQDERRKRAFSGEEHSLRDILVMTARAKAFSCVVVVIGTPNGPNSILPKHAIIVRSKEQLLIPLKLSTLPSAKEFQDAVQSLSPEQLRFANAYRAMKLESSVIAFCVLEVKSQLERLLRLEQHSLDKELSLCEAILNLLTEHNVPPDVIAVPARDEGRPPAERMEIVRKSVAAVQEMIDAEKIKQKQEAVQQWSFEALGGGEHCASPVDYAPLSRPRRERTMSEHSVPKSPRISDIDRQIELLKKEMSCNIEKVLDRGECIETLVSRSDDLQSQARQFKKRSSTCTASAVDDIAMNVACATMVCESGVSELERAMEISKDDRHGSPSEASSMARASDGAPDSSCALSCSRPCDDYTQLQVRLDKLLQGLDTYGSVRPTTVDVFGEEWLIERCCSIIGKPKDDSIGPAQQQEERAKAFDFLNTLTRSGELVYESAQLHVMVVATHCFTDTLVNTVVKHDVNPIEVLERSIALCVQGIHGEDANSVFVKHENA